MKLYTTVQYLIHHVCGEDVHVIDDALSVQTVFKAVNSLNSDKSDGDRGYNSNHLLYAGHMFYAELSNF